jgi:hypothetical protein
LQLKRQGDTGWKHTAPWLRTALSLRWLVRHNPRRSFSHPNTWKGALRKNREAEGPPPSSLLLLPPPLSLLLLRWTNRPSWSSSGSLGERAVENGLAQLVRPVGSEPQPPPNMVSTFTCKIPHVVRMWPASNPFAKKGHCPSAGKNGVYEPLQQSANNLTNNSDTVQIGKL